MHAPQVPGVQWLTPEALAATIQALADVTGVQVAGVQYSAACVHDDCHPIVFASGIDHAVIALHCLQESSVPTMLLVSLSGPFQVSFWLYQVRFLS
jgi:hypothetical protein